MSTPIYTSEKILPYVYIGTHRETDQFYIGYRAINKIPSHLDLGTNYFTSSEVVKELGFENFNWIIIAEFFDRLDAYKFEQELIYIHFNDHLNLNAFHDKSGKFSMIGRKQTKKQKEKMSKKFTGVPKSEEHRKKIGEGNKGKIVSIETREKISENNGSKRPEVKAKISKANKGKKRTDEQKVQMSITSQNMSKETKQKISETRIGEGNGMYGKHHTEEARLKIGIASKNRKPDSDETRRKKSENSGSRRPEVREKLSKAGKGKPQQLYTCPGCGSIGGIMTMKRWGHGDNCTRDPQVFRGKLKLS